MKLYYLLFIIFLSGCAQEAAFTIDNKTVVVKPYGWANARDEKNDSVVYKVNVSNIVLSILFSETVVIPIWLTGFQLYEPLKKLEVVPNQEYRFRNIL